MALLPLCAVVGMIGLGPVVPLHAQPTVVAVAASDPDAEVRTARALAVAGRHDESLAAWDRLLAAHPAHREARLGRATTLAWAGRYDEARVALASLRTDAPGRDIERLAARLLAWDGAHHAAEAAYRELLRVDRADAEAWFGLAQVLHWMARQDEAVEAVDAALALAPKDADIRALATSLRDARRPLVAPRVLHSNDTDGNTIRLATVDLAPRERLGWTWQLGATAKEARLGALAAQSVGAQVAARWSRADDRVRTGLTVGLAQLHGATAATGPGANASVVRPVLVARGAVRPHAAVTVGVAASEVPFDESALLITRAVRLRSVSSDVGVALPRGVTLGLVAEQSSAQGGLVRNTRRSVEGRVAWSATPTRTLSLRGQALAWDTVGRADGYFAPRALAMLEIGGRQVFGDARGLGATLEGGVGPQSLLAAAGATAATTIAARGSIAVHLATARGHLLELVGGASSLASALARGDRPYRIQYLALRARAPL
jgi:Flp pilus assembly protein TadD